MGITDNNKETNFEILPYIECHEGWRPLVNIALDTIEEENRNLDEDNKIYPVQIKEKFGRLEIYLNHYSEKLFDLITSLREESLKTCEYCGTKENVGITIDGWYMTICKDCLQKYIESGVTLRSRTRRWRRNSDHKIFDVSADNIKEVKIENEHETNHI